MWSLLPWLKCDSKGFEAYVLRNEPLYMISKQKPYGCSRDWNIPFPQSTLDRDNKKVTSPPTAAKD